MDEIRWGSVLFVLLLIAGIVLLIWWGADPDSLSDIASDLSDNLLVQCLLFLALPVFILLFGIWLLSRVIRMVRGWFRF